MNRATFFKHFELLADQPDAVARMRDLILDCAVRGKLVQQDSKDKPAISNLSEIEEEKRALIHARKLRQNLVTEISKTKSLQYNIPKTWRWFRLGDVVFFQEGPGIRNWQFKTQGIKLLNVQNIVDGKLILENSDRYISAEEFEKTYKHFAVETGDILFASSGGSWGKIAWFEDPRYTVMLNTSMVRLKFYSKRCDDKFLFHFLQTAFFRNQMEVQLAGIQPNFGSTHLSRVYIPLPPLAEQRRIVAKVDELMALCDELEKRQEARRETRKKFQHAALHHLLDAREPKTFATGWQRVRDHFHQLHETPDSIPQLRQAILQLAVQGKLISQNAKDEPAELLLGHVRLTKQQLAKAAGQKPPKAWPQVEPDEFKQILPTNWSITRLGDLAINIEAGFSPQCEGRRRNEGEWGVLKISAVSWDKFDPEENKALPANVKPREEFEVRDGDFLMSRANTAELVAKSVIAIKPPRKLLLNDKTLRVRFTEHTEKQFINLVNNSLMARHYYAAAASGTSDSMKNITREAISMLPIGLPPLAEQKRIVARVEELMRLCDALEAQLNQSQTLGTRLLESTLHHLLAA